MDRPLTRNIRPDAAPLTCKEYEKAGGYAAVRKALTSMSRDEVVAEVKESGLRGLGGAGFPTALKWSFVPQGEDAPRPKYLVANGDEMEPGTFKDRLLLEGDPHSFIEGMIVSGYAIDADVGYIFLRWGLQGRGGANHHGARRSARGRVPRQEHPRLGFRLRSPPAHECRPLHVR